MKKQTIVTLVIISVGVLLVPFIALATSDECECVCTCPNKNTNLNKNMNSNQNINQPKEEYSNQIIINEIFPNPEGSDSEAEFIELKNLSNQEISLENWQIADSSKDYKIAKEDFNSLVIPARGYFVIYRNASSIALNNSGEEAVYLYQPSGDLLDEVVYSASQEGKSYSLNQNSEWLWTGVTPGEENIFEEVEEEDEDDEEEIKDQPDEDQNINSNQNINNNQNSNQEPKKGGYSDKVIISEIFPNPEGSDSEAEFIELFNSGQESINLEGWQLSDATTKKYTLTSEIQAGEYLVVYSKDSKISLNNTDDQVELYWPNEKLFQNIEYTGCQENKSYSFDGENWQWQEPTPGSQNVFLDQAALEDNLENNKNEKREETNPVTSTFFDLPPQNRSKQILYGLLAGGAVALLALGVVGARYYKKRIAEK